MPQPKFFKTLSGLKLPLPVFFPDATRAVIKTVDSTDIKNTNTPGILVNTFHLSQNPGKNIILKSGGIKKFMNWSGGVISDSGGFQVMSLAKSLGKYQISNWSITFLHDNKKITFTPRQSIELQLALQTDMVVVLDDFTDPKSSRKDAQDSVRRTILWAQKCKQIFLEQTKNLKNKPYLLGVVQGGKYQDLRQTCTKELVDIGFDGLGYGGWPLDHQNNFDFISADTIRQNTPDNYFLYGLGVGKPQDITQLVKNGWHIFDCVLPTRDARHHRLYVWKDNKTLKYDYFIPDKYIHSDNPKPISQYCSCHLCQNYSRSYLYHLFKIGDSTALRLSTIHNLHFYQDLMRKLRT